jgi:GTP-binding protein LepA
MLFASVFPVDTQRTDDMLAAVDRLLLNDSSVSITHENSVSLGTGLRCGFLGFLHMEVIA